MMAARRSSSGKGRVYRIVLTGGPCAGKTTAQTRLTDFFENLGWKVYHPPETASLLLNSGVNFHILSKQQAYQFQEDVFKTILQIEDTFFNMARGSRDQDVLVICDRGALDASAFVEPEEWDKILKDNNWDPIKLRDDRYHHVVHLVSAAVGAEKFYTLVNNTARSEGLELAKVQDRKAQEAWIGHPYFDVVDNNCASFEEKMQHVVATVSARVGVETQDRLASGARKLKFLVSSVPEDFPVKHRDFDVVHHYLTTVDGSQARVRKRGWKESCTYVHTIRRPQDDGQWVETRLALSVREYQNLMSQIDPSRLPVVKIRRSFLWQNLYFQLDMYQEPCHERCKGLMLLELYTTKKDVHLPDFLTVEKEVTTNPDYSMFNLCAKDE